MEKVGHVVGKDEGHIEGKDHPDGYSQEETPKMQGFNLAINQFSFCVEQEHIQYEHLGVEAPLYDGYFTFDLHF